MRLNPVKFLAFLLLVSAHAAMAAISIYDRLEHVEREPRLRKPSSADEVAIIRRVEAVPAQTIIPVRPGSKRTIRVTGTLQQYVASIVSNTGKSEKWLTTSGFVPCSGIVGHQCVAVRGDPCSRSKNEDCEGMFLFVAVDVTNGYKLDRAIGAGYYVVRSANDIEELKAEAP
jgi:hypothetical protein